MRSVRTSVIGMAVLLVLVLTACGDGRGPDPIPPVGTAADAGVPVDFTQPVPGVAPERVTDVTAASLTDDQVADIRDACEDLAGVPGIDLDCLTDYIAKLPPRVLRPCDRLRACVVWGSVAGSDVGVVQVRDDRPGSPACGGPTSPRCGVVVVPARVVASLKAAAAPSPTGPTTVAQPTTAAPATTAAPTTAAPITTAPITTAPPTTAAPAPPTGPGR